MTRARVNLPSLLLAVCVLSPPLQAQAPVQCPSGQYDVLDFLFNDDPTVANQLRRYDLAGQFLGSTQELRTYWPANGRADGHFYIAKQSPDPRYGLALEFEELFVDANYIYLARDTSWQPEQWCTGPDGQQYNTSFELWRIDGTARRLGGLHFPRCVQVGMEYRYSNQLLQPRFEGESAHQKPASLPPESLRCRTCTVGVWPREAPRRFRVVSFEPSKSFAHSGPGRPADTVTVPNVLTIDALTDPEGVAFERYYYSREWGWVGYEDIVNTSGQKAYYAGPAAEGNPFEITILDLCPWIGVRPVAPPPTCASQALELTLLHPLPNGTAQEARVAGSTSGGWSVPNGNATFAGAADGGQLVLNTTVAPAGAGLDTLRASLATPAGTAEGLLSEFVLGPALPTPTGFRVVAQSPGVNATVAWDALPAPGQTIVGYEVYVLDGSLLVTSSSCQGDASATFGVLAGRRYDVQVRAFDAFGRSSRVGTYSFTAEAPQCLQGTCLPVLPNLRPTAIQYELVNLFAGQTIAFDSGVQNAGGQASGAFQVRWRVDGQDVGGGTHASVPADTTELTGNSRVEWLATAGEHVVTFVVDTTAAVTEANELDNSRALVVRISPDPRPDLTPLAFRYRPADLVEGGTVTFETSTRNLGLGDAPAFTLQWRVDGEAQGPARTHPGVDAGATLVDDAGRLSWPASAGTHVIEVTLDVENTIAEADEGNNVRRLVVDVPETLRPDLAPTTLRFNAAAVAPGNAVLFDSGVRNLGAVASEAFDIRWFVDGREVAAGSHAGLPAATTVLNGNSQFSWTVLPGRHSIAFEVDSSGRIEESNEGNNRVTVAVGEPASTDVDLVAQGISYSATQMVADAQVVFSAGVRNAGSDPAGGFDVRWEVDGVEQVRGAYPIVAPATTLVAAPARFVWRARPGRHTLTFDVDTDNTIAETQEGNNRRSITLTVPEAALPDLRPTAIRYPAASLAAGSPVLLDAGVANAGLGAAADFNVRWTIDGVALGAGAHAGVAPGATVLDGNSQYTWTPTLGTHVVAFEVDADQHVRETNEANNRVSSILDVPAAPRPDLRPTAIAYTPAAPRAGESIVFDSGVRNLGLSAAGPFAVRWRVDGAEVASGLHDGVPGGALVTNGNSSATWTATPGVHTVTFSVDADNTISELSESNNEVTTSLAVSGPLVLGTLSISSQANILAAGYAGSGAFGGGLLPPSIALPPGTGRVLTFSVTGSALSCCGAPGRHGADGGTNLQTFISSNSAISGVRHHSRNIFLLGAFLGDGTPAGAAPAALAYHEPADAGSPPAGALSTRAATYAPLVRQAFFVGDGLANAGEVQRFQVPDEATRLFLGFADGLNLGAPGMGTPSPALPCCYTDNVGTLGATVTLTR
jgi:subtilase family serine protease